MNLQTKIGEILSITKGIITLLVFRGLADSLTRHTFDHLIHHPTKYEPKSRTDAQYFQVPLRGSGEQLSFHSTS
jgi:hypothetical protein